jgi:hypothetical protein
MATTGMNPAEVRYMADQLREAADRLRGVVAAVDGRVARSSWVGPQADRFRGQAWPGHRKRLLLAADALQGLARSAWNNADEQERVSSASVSGGPSLPGRIVGELADNVTGLGKTGGMELDGALLGLLGLPGLLAPGGGKGALKTWTGYYQRIVRWAPGPVRGVLDRMTPAFRAADRTPFTDLRNSEATRWLRTPGKYQDLVKIGDAPALNKLGTVFGVYSVATEVAGVNQAWRSGDKVGAGLHAVDAVASTAKMSKNPLLFAAGVGVDGVTDLVNFARGKPEKDWRPWNLL